MEKVAYIKLEFHYFYEEIIDTFEISAERLKNITDDDIQKLLEIYKFILSQDTHLISKYSEKKERFIEVIRGNNEKIFPIIKKFFWNFNEDYKNLSDDKIISIINTLFMWRLSSIDRNVWVIASFCKEYSL